MWILGSTAGLPYFANFHEFEFTVHSCSVMSKLYKSNNWALLMPMTNLCDLLYLLLILLWFIASNTVAGLDSNIRLFWISHVIKDSDRKWRTHLYLPRQELGHTGFSFGKMCKFRRENRSNLGGYTIGKQNENKK